MSRPSHALPAAIESAPLPEVINHTEWPAQYFQHVDPHGEIFHVMVAKTSYSLASFVAGANGLPEPALLPPDKQPPLCEADAFAGEVNASSVLQESDFAPYKPKCDVLLVNTVAYSPGGKPMRRWPVGFRFGDAIQKTLQVTGRRHFGRSLGTLGILSLTEPEPCTEIRIDYERAFGGPNLIGIERALASYSQPAHPDKLAQLQHDAARQAERDIPPHYSPNPIGCGREPIAVSNTRMALARVEGMAMTAQDARRHEDAARQQPVLGPQIEAFDRRYREEADYPTIGFGPVGRWWAPRIRLAGTHDERWKQTQWPKSPLDHDYRYWNCAPEDQQIDYPQGGEEIVLANLTPRPANDGGPIRFVLPRQDLQLLVRLEVGVLMFAPMNIDTVLIDFKTATLSVARRATVSAKAGVRQLELGTWPPGTAMQLDNTDEQVAQAKVKRERHHG